MTDKLDQVAILLQAYVNLSRSGVDMPMGIFTKLKKILDAYAEAI